MNAFPPSQNIHIQYKNCSQKAWGEKKEKESGERNNISQGSL